MPVPFIGRLNITEYVALVGSFFLVGLEAIIRILTLALPRSLISLFYRASRRLFHRFTTPAQNNTIQRKRSLSITVRDASDFVDLCRVFGYEAEEHVTQTKDGFLLGLHRLAWKRGEEGQRVNSGRDSVQKKVVYLHHGLLMNSEVWVSLTDAQRCLPFVLVEKGYDVWLGNNRGNKYSKKSIKYSPTSVEFWNFSMDEFALHDIPDSISYILETTGQESLSYIGFSQGTAQAFAALAIHPKLNDKVNVFIALAPAMSPAGLSNGVVDALVKASPQVLFLLFGRRSILSSTTMWQSILYPPIFVKIIDYSLGFLFDWQTKNISWSQKLAAYPHLYSFTSTKSVVHWFQIIRNKAFQMYDDDVQPPVALSSSSKYTKVARYPTRNIKTPIVLVYGGTDSLVDIKVMLRELPKMTVATEIPHYEHLDFLWGHDVDAQVFPHVFDALQSFTDPHHSSEEYAKYQLARQESLLGSGAPYRNHGEKSGGSGSDTSTTEALSTGIADEAQGDADAGSRVTPRTPQHRAREEEERDAVVSLNASPLIGRPRIADDPRQLVRSREGGPNAEQLASPGKLKGTGVRRSSISGSGSGSGSIISLDTGRGISLGTGRAVGGVVTTGGVDKGITTSPTVVNDNKTKGRLKRT
ncbi:alpha/beta-hydrolase [Sodiomyces alkalinus F11]|uniref:Alpha/beta-hydrolase n=1 Tax=Sodiomyces alkalinus (strain CBS 110278 / VKM F-3762 / F11) TaxID=1314773 RepID=A0A3N2PSX6_SODAK|nr:alpha/beta-hydrolase [Sodiomyces alkalinus F11]ROT37623.1 alpha/beta-hydrolase [Sodiomyces alkalinus F11]